MRSPRQFPPDPHDVLLDQRGPDEWIVDAPGHERPLHVFRLGPSDWLSPKSVARSRVVGEI
jgi:hypothetical protein